MIYLQKIEQQLVASLDGQLKSIDRCEARIGSDRRNEMRCYANDISSSELDVLHEMVIGFPKWIFFPIIRFSNA